MNKKTSSPFIVNSHIIGHAILERKIILQKGLSERWTAATLRPDNLAISSHNQALLTNGWIDSNTNILYIEKLKFRRK